jgi:chromatin remodeling complex protein RSC6
MARQKNSAFMKPVYLSSNLENIVGSGPMPRTEVTKKLWDYIKKNNRQDPNNKRNIIPDDNLSQLFGTSDAVDMFKMTSLVSKHMSPDSEFAKS